MKPVEQSRKDGTGDCIRACLASILELPLSEVPDFTLDPNSDKDDPDTGYPIWYLDLQGWLAGKGFFFLEVKLSSGIQWNPLPFACHTILIGPRNSIGGICRHAIVGVCEGHSFIPHYDPLGGNPMQAFHNGQIESACFLVPLKAAMQVTLGKAMDRIHRLARQLPVTSEVNVAILHESAEALGISLVSIPPVTLPFTRETIRKNAQGEA